MNGMDLEVSALSKVIHTSESVAKELYILSGEQPDIVITASKISSGLNECKARVIDERIRRSEEQNRETS